jgi:RNA polymerase sigma factor (sigma-70 family)
LTEFVRRYGRRIYAWARARGLKTQDAEDIMQDVLIRLLKVLRTFTYDREKRFSGLVCVITQHAVNDLLQERRRQPQGTGSEAIAELLASMEAADDLGRQLEEEYKRERFDEACRRVQLRVTPLVWRRFWLTVDEGLGGGGLSIQEAAEREEVEAKCIHQARYKVIGQLNKEIRRLDGTADLF